MRAHVHGGLPLGQPLQRPALQLRELSTEGICAGCAPRDDSSHNCCWHIVCTPEETRVAARIALASGFAPFNRPLARGSESATLFCPGRPPVRGRTACCTM
eukprot:6213713-Pleurochrysis_carterae.AAC.5